MADETIRPAGTAGPTVLVVEDDLVVAETLEAYLQQAGYGVRLTRDGREGLALASSGEYALVILDLMIPGMPGLDVCRELRRVSQVPVLMLTARTTEDDHVRGFERGADDYVGKPFSPREVVCRVQALLRRVAPSDTSRPAPDRHGVVEIDRWARTVRVEGRADRRHADRVRAARRRAPRRRASAHARRAARPRLRARLRGHRSHRRHTSREPAPQARSGAPAALHRDDPRRRLSLVRQRWVACRPDC